MGNKKEIKIINKGNGVYVAENAYVKIDKPNKKLTPEECYKILTENNWKIKAWNELSKQLELAKKYYKKTNNEQGVTTIELVEQYMFNIEMDLHIKSSF